MTTEAKKRGGPYRADEAGQVYDGEEMLLQISLNVPPAQRAAWGRRLAEIFNRAAPSDIEAGALAAPPAQRSEDSITDSGYAWFLSSGLAARGSFERADMLDAYRAGAGMALSAMAADLIDAAWTAGYDGHVHGDLTNVALPGEIDLILERVVGKIGPVLAWPKTAPEMPSLGEVGELVVWLISDCTETERQWRDSGIADQKPEEFQFIMNRLGAYRRAANMLRQVSRGLLGSQKLGFEIMEAMRRSLNEIRGTARPGAGPAAYAKIRALVDAALLKLGVKPA